MAYLDGDRPCFALDWRRVLLGVVAAPTFPSLLFGAATSIPPELIAQLAGLGFLSVLTLYLPLIVWRLPRTRRPLLTCIIAGMAAAPGMLGYAALLMIVVAGGGSGLALAALAFTVPLGAVGGFVFWLCAVWRSDSAEADPG